MNASRSDRVLEDLTEAAGYLQPAPGARSWSHGLHLEQVRRSPQAAFDGPAGPMRMDASGLAFFESAVGQLLRETAIQARWSPDELWGVVADLLAQAGASRGRIEAALAHLRQAPVTLVVLPISNVRWQGAPVFISDSVIGLADRRLLDEIGRRAEDRPALALENLVHAGPEVPLFFATWVSGQQDLAVQQADDRLRSLLDLSLLFAHEPAALGLHSLRGEANRPGVRGLEIHRPALERALAGAGELHAQVKIVSARGTSETVRWYSSDVFPLEDLLSNSVGAQRVAQAVLSDDPVSRRLRVAARWYAAAHWSSREPDAVLALGVALDALIGSRAGLPGRALRERFGLLEPDPALRAARAKRFGELYSARSAVAHGSSSSGGPGARTIAAEVVWTAERLLAVSERFEPRSQEHFDECFEQLRWGTATW